MSPPGGGTWDPRTATKGARRPDLFCEYENPASDVSPTTAGVTDTIIDVFTANWDQTITPPGVTVSASALMASKPAWRIWVGDEDCASPTTAGRSGQIACSYQQPISAAVADERRHDDQQLPELRGADAVVRLPGAERGGAVGRAVSRTRPKRQAARPS